MGGSMGNEMIKYYGTQFVDAIASDTVISHEEADCEDTIVQESCTECLKKIKDGTPAMAQLDSTGDPFLWYCSKACVQKHIEAANIQGDRDCKRDREDPHRRWQYNPRTKQDERR